MRTISRRDLLTSTGSFVLAAGACGPARAIMGPNDKFDLLIKGADIDESRALRVLNAAGKLVTPGLVDLHCHVFPYGSAIGIPADELVAHQCTTTCVSAGDAGANNFAAFRRHIVAQTQQ